MMTSCASGSLARCVEASACSAPAAFYREFGRFRQPPNTPGLLSNFLGGFCEFCG
jgi:hypothetical protein